MTVVKLPVCLGLKLTQKFCFSSGYSVDNEGCTVKYGTTGQWIWIGNSVYLFCTSNTISLLWFAGHTPNYKITVGGNLIVGHTHLTCKWFISGSLSWKSKIAE